MEFSIKREKLIKFAKNKEKLKKITKIIRLINEDSHVEGVRESIEKK